MPDAKPIDRAVEISLLTLVAGSADALGYLNLGRVFTSNMTGNVVLMGIALSEGRGADTGRSLFAFAAFLLGNCLGAWICSRAIIQDALARAITLTISGEAAFLAAFAFSCSFLLPEQQSVLAYPMIALLGTSMGLQAAAIYRLGTPGVTTTAITGTLTALFAGLMKSLNFAPDLKSKPERPSLALQAGVILLYCGGAATSGAINIYARPWAGFFPAALVIAVLGIRLRR